MIRTNSSIALGLLATALAAPVSAEPTPGPPEWHDRGASVYSRMNQQPSPNTAKGAETPIAKGPAELSAATAAPDTTQPIVDFSVTPAAHQEPASTGAVSDHRHLAPPSARSTPPATVDTRSESRGGLARTPRKLVDFGVPTASMYTILTALAVVIGAFLIFAWALRRGGRQTGRNSILPADVVSVLGRVPLAARQFAELLRVGNKLVLVSLTPTGPETITEVTDPVEVDRLVGLCQQYNPHSTTKAFEQVFHQLSRESAPSGFLGNDALPPSLTSAAAAYRAHRGDTRRG